MTQVNNCDTAGSQSALYALNLRALFVFGILSRFV